MDRVDPNVVLEYPLYRYILHNLEWEMAAIVNETNVLNKQPAEYNEATVRKAVYQKMQTYWPLGHMDSATLSAQYSTFKRKREKDAAIGGACPTESYGYIVRVDPFTPIISRKTKEEVKGVETPVVKAAKRKSVASTGASADKKIKVLGQ